MDDNEIQKMELNNVINAFNQLAISMPSIIERYLKLIGANLTDEQKKDADALFKEILDQHMAGKNILVSILASHFLLAELIIQVKKKRAEKLNKETQPGNSDLVGYV